MPSTRQHAASSSADVHESTSVASAPQSDSTPNLCVTDGEAAASEAELVGMGFSRRHVKEALRTVGSGLERALAWLLDGGSLAAHSSFLRRSPAPASREDLLHSASRARRATRSRSPTPPLMPQPSSASDDQHHLHHPHRDSSAASSDGTVVNDGGSGCINLLTPPGSPASSSSCKENERGVSNGSEGGSGGHSDDRPATLLPRLPPSVGLATRYRAIQSVSGPAPFHPSYTNEPRPSFVDKHAANGASPSSSADGRAAEGRATGLATTPTLDSAHSPRHPASLSRPPGPGGRSAAAPRSVGTSGPSEGMLGADGERPRYAGAGDDVPQHPCVALQPAEREAFERDGFVILRNLVPQDECRRFLWQAVEPALRAKGVSYDDESTWGGKSGDVIMAPDGGNHPIPPSNPDSRWPALFQSARLRQVLDDLHGGKGRWRWVHGAASGVGWIHVRYPVIEPSEAWDWEDRRWHIDGSTGRIDTHQSVVVLPMVTPIEPGGGGTALLRGSHHIVAKWLHDVGEWGVGNHRRIRTIVEKAVASEGLSAIVEATGDAGDVLLMHPLLIHAVNDARRVTFKLVSSEGEPARWTAVQHGIRVTFNLSTHWARQPLVLPDWDNGCHPRSALEHSIVAPIGRSILDDPTAKERVLFYGEVLELRFAHCGMMLGVEDQWEGLAFASYPRVPARSCHDLRIHAPGKVRGGVGLPVCYGDEIVLKSRGPSGTWRRLGVNHVRDLPTSLRSLCTRSGEAGAEASVVCVQWGERHTTPHQLFRVEAYCDLRGVPLRAGDKFYLRAIGCVREGAPHGCGHLVADPDADDLWRHVGARKPSGRGEQGESKAQWSFHEIEAFKVGPMRSAISDHATKQLE